ncbi:sensor histidine kinase [Marinobacter sp. F3R11]|uniref:sensor histidine kinase n=1 Tax=Marinobacter sp. F3R11 TaxID=2267231 RepID=UPI000DE8780F|nr:ATP-binding protein [Marinobacter sp. F3R11]RBW48206.1 histidine kinase [Marinobacter sp. F3R11]
MATDTVSAVSTGKRTPGFQQAKLFRIYNHYRVVISLVLVALLFVDPVNFDTRFRFLDYYQFGVMGYLALNGFISLTLLAGFQPKKRHITLSILLDILILHGLLLTSTGVTNGLANLVIVSVAAGNILTPSRTGTFYAALAAISSLSVSGWAMLTLGESADEIVRAGSLGIVYFAAAFILQNISRRMMKSEALASSRAQSIVELEQINQQIIQRMRTGILVLDRHNHIRLANAAAEELLFGIPTDDLDVPDTKSRDLPQPLKSGLDAWLKNPEKRTEPFQSAPTSPLLQVNFTQLDQERGDQILVFIEDMSKVTQQAQHMKLASLGRLTAGIAHEIRNPLGAISHAAQLMEESDHLDRGDAKMLDIIQRHSRRVNGIIENVLSLSRRKSANADLVDVGNWLKEFRTDFLQTQENTVPATVVRLNTASTIPEARFDKSQIEQVMVNLCDNGLRYSHQHSGERKIELRAGATADGKRAYVDVRDFGPGIEPSSRHQVFEPFYTTDKGGTGLGLYLAKELCEANQAHLSLVEDNQPGCCFRITFAPPGRLI